MDTVSNRSRATSCSPSKTKNSQTSLASLGILTISVIVTQSLPYMYLNLYVLLGSERKIDLVSILPQKLYTLLSSILWQNVERKDYQYKGERFGVALTTSQVYGTYSMIRHAVFTVRPDIRYLPYDKIYGTFYPTYLKTVFNPRPSCPSEPVIKTRGFSTVASAIVLKRASGSA